MNRCKALLVWVSRIMHCRGFGIQSPTDYWMVRYVINEHWPYYPYATIGQGDDWLRKKKGRLYFRLANWRQPRVITSRDYREYLQAGCRKAAFGNGDELMFLTVENGWRTQAASFLNKVDSNSVLVVEDIWKDWDGWREIMYHPSVTVSFDLYYCGILLFDKKRTKQHYIINF